MDNTLDIDVTSIEFNWIIQRDGIIGAYDASRKKYEWNVSWTELAMKPLSRINSQRSKITFCSRYCDLCGISGKVESELNKSGHQFLAAGQGEAITEFCSSGERKWILARVCKSERVKLLQRIILGPLPIERRWARWAKMTFIIEGARECVKVREWICVFAANRFGQQNASRFDVNGKVANSQWTSLISRSLRIIWLGRILARSIRSLFLDVYRG